MGKVAVGKVATGLLVIGCCTVMGFLTIFCMALLAKGDFMGDDSFSESWLDLLAVGNNLAGGFKFATWGLV